VFAHLVDHFKQSALLEETALKRNIPLLNRLAPESTNHDDKGVRLAQDPWLERSIGSILRKPDEWEHSVPMIKQLVQIGKERYGWSDQEMRDDHVLERHNRNTTRKSNNPILQTILALKYTKSFLS